ncbi:MAG TPA: hypothetical protein VF099_11640 [Ktedonobacterales bacterium]
MTPTRCIAGWPTISATGWLDCSPINRVGYAGGIFDQRTELTERLRHGPGGNRYQPPT